MYNVCVRGEQSQEMHSLAADECDEMSFCLFKALDFDLYMYGVFHSLLYVCLHYTTTVPLQPMNVRRNVSTCHEVLLTLKFKGSTSWTALCGMMGVACVKVMNSLLQS